jgi:hypothetical protein
MTLDSEAQRTLLMDLLRQVPVNTTIGGIIAGLRPDIQALLATIQQAEVAAKKPPALDEETHTLNGVTHRDAKG